jgi:triosephosphate isomerase
MIAPQPPAVRTPILAGNWKMNKSPREARDFFRVFCAAYAPRHDRTVVLFPPFVSLAACAEATAQRDDILLGVQNIYWQRAGAFTGEISAPLAAAAGARFTLAGHSERRHIFRETDDEVGRKAAAAVDAGLVPIVCVGETLEERREGRLEEVLDRQLAGAISPEGRALEPRFLLAYEPVWAIGTGVNATPDDASAAHCLLRARLADRFGVARARALPILYGGSVKPENCAELLAASDVDGLLVGGASLDAEGFARIAASSPAR